MSILLEVVATSVESARAAERGGADRLELCVNLAQGGTTPPADMIRAVRDSVHIPIHVMIRPRPGTFSYSESELEQMRAELQTATIIGADGVVLGILNSDLTVDVDRTRDLVRLARPLPVTFHRAFDETPDAQPALDHILEAGAARILTSGQQPSAFDGRILIHDLVQRAGNRIRILAGAGINHKNARTLVQDTGVVEIHAASAVMAENRIIDEDLVRSLKEIVQKEPT